MNHDHLKILKQGVETWNQWRIDNPSLQPDLNCADLCKELYSIWLNVPSDIQFPWIEYEDKHSGPSLTKIDFSNCNMYRVNLRGAHLGGANFRHTNLHESCLTDAFLVGADMRNCDLGGANLEKATLDAVDFRGATLCANMAQCHLSQADIRGANLRYADISGSRIHEISYDSKTKFRGIDVTGIKGCPSFKQYAMDQDYIEEMRETKWKKPVYWLWKATSNCGRSWGRWALWSCTLAVGFGAWFYSLGESAFHSLHLSWSFWTALYYSVITFTTLGFGDITPTTGLAAFVVALEVIAGYIMLGGLVALIASRMAR